MGTRLSVCLKRQPKSVIRKKAGSKACLMVCFLIFVCFCDAEKLFPDDGMERLQAVFRQLAIVNISLPAVNQVIHVHIHH